MKLNPLKLTQLKTLQIILFFQIWLLVPCLIFGQTSSSKTELLTYEVNPEKQTLRLFWKDDNGQIINDFASLNQYVSSKGETLIFAMNGGMFTQSYDPLGLYMEAGTELHPLNQVQKAYGNFYLQPNGVFFLAKDGKAGVCKSTDFEKIKNVEYATQSGPMLVIDGKMHPAFNEGSPNVHIRNAVGILPNGNVLFVMSKRRMNFYELASFFMEKGCKNALYLDGFVSRTYLPAQDWEQMDGRFGVMIGEVK
ncbi:MAG: phosphodiester glycosidase family protein [Bacteroidetes bacterium]|nr:phosphodiester glycosidase family protein [Bacteroidota bacterium]MCB0843311.1 phosphodiester glycosidase family protein [Bacteroidota bacterium]